MNIANYKKRIAKLRRLLEEEKEKLEDYLGDPDYIAAIESAKNVREKYRIAQECKMTNLRNELTMTKERLREALRKTVPVELRSAIEDLAFRDYNVRLYGKLVWHSPDFRWILISIRRHSVGPTTIRQRHVFYDLEAPREEAEKFSVEGMRQEKKVLQQIQRIKKTILDGCANK